MYRTSKIIIGACLLVFSLLARGESFEWGKAIPTTHDIAMAELLGRPDFFDGQPVAVIGIASFNFGFEQGSALYQSRDDYSYATQANVKIDFGEKYSGPKESLTKLAGKFVYVQGTFHAYQRKKITDSSKFTLCWRSCPPAGTISDIRLVVELQPFPRDAGGS